METNEKRFQDIVQKGKFLGAGEAGSVYCVNVTPELAWLVAQLRQEYRTRVRFDTDLPVGTRVAVKVIPAGGGGRKDSLFLSHFVKVKCSDARLCVRRHVPMHYFSLFDAPPVSSFGTDRLDYVVMQNVRGGPLADIVDDPGAFPKDRVPYLYVALERAFLSLWSAGVYHRDAHDENIMVDIVNVDKDGFPRVTFIDFGGSSWIPPNDRKLLRRSLPTFMSAGTWSPAIGAYRSRLNSNAGATEFWWEFRAAVSESNLKRVRRIAYGVKVPTVTNIPQQPRKTATPRVRAALGSNSNSNKTNTGAKLGGLTVWRGPRGGHFVVRGGVRYRVPAPREALT